MSELLAEHRHTLARQGYVVIEAHLLDFQKRLKCCEPNLASLPLPRPHCASLMRGIQACADAVALLKVLHGLALTHYGQAPSPLIPVARPGSCPGTFSDNPQADAFPLPQRSHRAPLRLQSERWTIPEHSDVLGTLSAFVHSLDLYHRKASSQPLLVRALANT